MPRGTATFLCKPFRRYFPLSEQIMQCPERNALRRRLRANGAYRCAVSQHSLMVFQGGEISS